jgi:crotonobetainyl-CoA:carnitine CoA-transferase CaiB-like acyl-CoA transferase
MRVKNRIELRKCIIGKFQKRPAAEWIEQLDSRSIPCSRIHTVADFTKEEQMQALNLLTPFPHPEIPELRLVDMPLSLDGKRALHQLPPPLLGSHTNEILTALGYDEEQINDLRKKGIVA